MQAVKQRPLVAAEGSVLYTATVEGVAGETEPKLGRVINIILIRPVVFWILRAPYRVQLEAMSRSLRRCAEA